MIDFNDYVIQAHKINKICGQPRMGFSNIIEMQTGLLAVASLEMHSVCTITLDSFTRVNNFEAPLIARKNNKPLNGYPIVSYSINETKDMIDEIFEKFKKPIQVRHGSSKPSQIFQRLVDVGISATEGGPISYCLPYSQTPIREAVREWQKSIEIFQSIGSSVHIESFAGCMLGQLCEPTLLNSLNILEGIFFQKHGLQSMSFSYAQGTSSIQDYAALAALQLLIKKYLPSIRHHIVLYSYMGVFPETILGSTRVIRDSVRVAKKASVSRIIVKTPLESKRIPSIVENIASLEFVDHCYADEVDELYLDIGERDRIFNDACVLIDSVLSLDSEIANCLSSAFNKGILDVPYCIHPDNKNKTQVMIDEKGYLKWSSIGHMPISKSSCIDIKNSGSMSHIFLNSLHFTRKKYDSLKIN